MGFVYLIQNKDLYKIGRTDNLQRRLQQLAPCVLLVAAQSDRSRDLEYELQSAYKHRRIPQTEYFRLTAVEVAEVRRALGGHIGFARVCWHSGSAKTVPAPLAWSIVLAATVAVFLVAALEPRSETSTVACVLLFGSLVFFLFFVAPAIVLLKIRDHVRHKR